VSFVFYDTETTGLAKGFDQILQFGAIRTDGDLNELHRIDVRSRVMPHIVPSPGALHVTNMCITEVTDPARPSHYQMVCEVRAALDGWCPSVFIGYNSMRFDEEFLRQAFYQCLHPPYLTNSSGSGRADALMLIRAAAVLHQDLIQVPEDEYGRPSYKLEAVATATGFDHVNAHDAMADVEATIHMCKLIKVGAPDLWSSFVRFAHKASVTNFLADEPAFVLFECYPSGHFLGPVAVIGSSNSQPNLRYCFDLKRDWNSLRDLDESCLRRALSRSPKMIRRLKVNTNPILFPLYDAPSCLGEDVEAEWLERAETFLADEELVERLRSCCEAGETIYPSSPHVEQQIYEGDFWDEDDKARSVQFHQVPWELRADLVNEFADARLKTIGLRLIYQERPDLLPAATRAAMQEEFRQRILGTCAEPGPWLIAASALQEVDQLIPTTAGEARLRLERYRARIVELLAA